jgi:hypothetical protein
MTTIRFRQEFAYDGPADDDQIIVTIRIFPPNGPPLWQNALLDTGAEYSLFDRALLPLLRIANLTSGRPYKVDLANNERKDAYLHNLDIEFGGHRITVPVGFSNDFPEGVVNVLGMKGFFDQFVFGLDHQTRMLFFTRGLLADATI